MTPLRRIRRATGVAEPPGHLLESAGPSAQANGRCPRRAPGTYNIPIFTASVLPEVQLGPRRSFGAPWTRFLSPL